MNRDPDVQRAFEAAVIPLQESKARLEERYKAKMEEANAIKTEMNAVESALNQLLGKKGKKYAPRSAPRYARAVLQYMAQRSRPVTGKEITETLGISSERLSVAMHQLKRLGLIQLVRERQNWQGSHEWALAEGARSKVTELGLQPETYSTLAQNGIVNLATILSHKWDDLTGLQGMDEGMKDDLRQMFEEKGLPRYGLALLEGH